MKIIMLAAVLLAFGFVIGSAATAQDEAVIFAAAKLQCADRDPPPAGARPWVQPARAL